MSTESLPHLGDIFAVSIMLVTTTIALFLLALDGTAATIQETVTIWPATTETPLTEPIVGQKVDDSRNNGNGTRISDSLIQKARTYTRKSPLFRNNSREELLVFAQEMETWEAPQVVRKSMPYYLAGSDYEGRPVWVSEFGKYDFASILKLGPTAIPLIEKYDFQFVWRVIKSLHARDTAEREIRQASLLVDCAGLDHRFLRYTSILEYCMRMAKDHRAVIDEITGSIIAINVNYAARAFFELMRPMLGNVFERVHLLGTNKARWLPKLKQFCPEETLPPWYGGREDFKPEEVY